jgi:addiction module HigA family antidote
MTSKNVLHPGLRIKAEVIPLGMSVTKAAELMGVGRPALSNLLNGKAALSPSMAARLERAFKYPLKDLMELQAQYETALAEQSAAPLDAKAYVPPFLAIKANAIEDWVSHNIQARSRLAVFLRTLVHSTGIGLKKVTSQAMMMLSDQAGMVSLKLAQARLGSQQDHLAGSLEPMMILVKKQMATLKRA